MRGQVLHYDEAQGFGFITGSDGNRYTFRREDIRQAFAVARGAAVEFRENGSQARDVGAVDDRPPGAAPAMPAAAAPAVHAAARQFGRNANGDAPARTGLWAYFVAAVTSKHLNFTDRARRKEYWAFCLFWFILFSVGFGIALYLDIAFGGFSIHHGWPVVSVTFSVLFGLATFLAGLSVAIRRIHDIGLSGWFWLLIMLPYVGWLVMLVFALIPSQKHENKWGPVPPGVRIATPAAG